MGVIAEDPKLYDRLEALTQQLIDGLDRGHERARRRRIRAQARARCSRSSSRRGPLPISRARESRIGRLFAKYFGAMLDRGIYLAPSPFEANFLSAAHTPTDVERTIAAADAVAGAPLGDRMIEPELKLAATRLETVAEPLGEVSIPRLYAYHRALRQAHASGKRTITSHGLAALLGHTIASTQIRKDLCALGPLGRRGQGYAIDPLVEQLAWVLGLEHDWRIAIVGFGYLGHAFAAFITARERRFNVAAIFDRSPAVIGQSWQGIAVRDVAEMERVLAETRCNIAVISVPAEAAQASAATRRRSRHSRDPQLRADAAEAARAGHRAQHRSRRRDGDLDAPLESGAVRKL